MPEFDRGEMRLHSEINLTTKEQEESLKRFIAISENPEITATFSNHGLAEALTQKQIADLYEGAKIYISEDHFENPDGLKLAKAIIESDEKKEDKAA